MRPSAIDRIVAWMMRHEMITIVLASVVGAIIANLLIAAISILSRG